jgi:S-adenosylmethionine:tRNA ribosyltransferase-isomerase
VLRECCEGAGIGGWDGGWDLGAGKDLMRTDDLDYPLDERLIATAPVEPRDSARLLVYERRTGAIHHRRVRDLPEYMGRGDLMVVNETTVMPARVKAVRERSSSDGSDLATAGARVEGLLLERRGPRRWVALLRNTKRLREGELLRLIGPGAADASGDAGRREEIGYGLRFVAREGEACVVEIEGGASADEVLERVGWTPLPPYITRARRQRRSSDQAAPSIQLGEDEGGPDGEEARDEHDDRLRYQTIYARPTDMPSVAAPTAGLHFTPELLERLDRAGVERTAVTLQVGAGTFKPVEAERLEDHRMHSERCFVSAEALRRLRAGIARSRAGTGRIVAIGTTSVRTLESIPARALEAIGGEGTPPATNVASNAGISACAGEAETAHCTEGPLLFETDILIAPGSTLRVVDVLLTNFHLPRSTLIALVAAFIGLDEVRRVYAVATAERYRFYSYGDAMLVV